MLQCVRQCVLKGTDCHIFSGSKLEKKICTDSVFFANIKYLLLLTCKSSKAIDNLLINSNIIFV